MKKHSVGGSWLPSWAPFICQFWSTICTCRWSWWFL